MNIRLETRILAVLSLLIAQGCASTSVTSFKDPAFEQIKFSNIIVIAQTGGDLQWRQSLENTMARAITEQGGNASPSMLLFPPTRNVTVDEARQILIENQVDGLVIIKFNDSGVEEVWVPQTGSTTTTSGTASVYGNTGTYSGQSHTTHHGGYSLDRPWVNMSTTFMDAASGRNVWVATSQTVGDSFADWGNIRESYCRKIANDMLTAGLW